MSQNENPKPSAHTKEKQSCGKESKKIFKASQTNFVEKITVAKN